MGFLSPWFLAGLAALGLPVYIHLLRRHVTTPRPFSSLMFFERGTQSSTRHRRLRYLVLFALRAAMLLLLVLAFANPFIHRTSAKASGKILLLVIDNSFSMNATSPSGVSHFADAKQSALRMLASRPRSEPAQVMALGGRLLVLTQPTEDSDALRSAVESIQPGDSRGNYGELGRGIRAIAETVSAPLELHLFSDMQKTAVPANFADMALPANMTLVLHPAGVGGNSPIPNWTVESINAPAQLADPKDTKTSRVQAVIAGYGTPAATRTASLVVNGKTIATRTVEVPANGRATVEFAPLDVPYGLSRCEVKIDSADRFPADDANVFAVKRSDPERALFVHEARDSHSPLYFGDALAAAAQASFRLQPVNAEQAASVDPSKYAFVVLSDVVSLPSIFENALSRYVESGGGLLIVAGTSAAHRAPIPVVGERSLDGLYYSRDGGFATVGQTDITDPVLNVGAAQDETSGGTATTTGAVKGATGWSELKFYYATRLDAAHSRVIARLNDGTPLLLEKQVGEGHLLLLASGLDNLTNDLPLHPAFVPFVDGVARYLSGSDRLSGSRLVDSFVQLRSGIVQPGQTASIEVVDPTGHRPLSLAEASSIQSFQLARAGFYQIRFANGKDALIGVNPDRRESDLEPIPNEILALWNKSPGPQPSQPQPASSIAAAANSEKKNAYRLWWYVMLLALVAAIAESIVASRHLGTQREEA